MIAERAPNPVRLASPSGRRRPRGVSISSTALLDPPTFLDECFEILRHPDVFRALRESRRGARER